MIQVQKELFIRIELFSQLVKVPPKNATAAAATVKVLAKMLHLFLVLFLTAHAATHLCTGDAQFALGICFVPTAPKFLSKISQKVAQISSKLW